MRLIDADALMAQVKEKFEKLYKSNDLLSDFKENLDNPSYIYRHGIKHYLDTCDNIEFLKAYLDGAPTIEAEPVRHGRWVINVNGNIECTECEYEPYWSSEEGKPKYCPNCGAKMDEEAD